GDIQTSHVVSLDGLLGLAAADLKMRCCQKPSGFDRADLPIEIWKVNAIEAGCLVTPQSVLRVRAAVCYGLKRSAAMPPKTRYQSKSSGPNHNLVLRKGPHVYNYPGTTNIFRPI